MIPRWTACEALFALAVMVLVGGCSGTAITTPAPSAAEPRTPAPSGMYPGASPGQTSKPLPSGVAMLTDGVLEPGTYRFDGFEPAVEVTVGDGWEVGHFHPDFFDLFHAGDFPSVGFARFATVKHRDGTTYAAVTAEAVVAALRSNPDLEVVDVGPVLVAGLAGRTVDIRAKREQSPLFSTPNGDFRFDPEFISRWHILEVDGGTMQILVAARPGKLDAAIEATSSILSSLRLITQ